MLAQEALCSIAGDRLTLDQHDERIVRVLLLMESSLSSPHSIADLARSSGMCVNVFMRVFKEVTGHTPQNYFIGLRIDRAVRLLLSSRLSIEEIADECGFCDRYHFTHAFARLHGMWPARFRRFHAHPLTIA
ncbi:MAG: AraC family transcriptional regulator [Kiritimatiellae bacterium]|nr:AraC family transcriptional regulator [Kiritimatiellia bacterium]